MKKDYARAYLANLEQLNMAEEVCGEFWNEVVIFLLLVFLGPEMYRIFSPIVRPKILRLCLISSPGIMSSLFL